METDMILREDGWHFMFKGTWIGPYEFKSLPIIGLMEFEGEIIEAVFHTKSNQIEGIVVLPAPAQTRACGYQKAF